jgi:hypothetical protein
MMNWMTVGPLGLKPTPFDWWLDQPVPLRTRLANQRYDAKREIARVARRQKTKNQRRARKIMRMHP